MKKQAVNIVNTLNHYIHYIVKFMQMLFLIKVYLHKLQRKHKLRTVLRQVLFGQSITLNLLDLYGVIHGAWPRHHINLLSFLL